MSNSNHPLLILKDDGHRVWGLLLTDTRAHHSQRIATALGVEPDEVSSNLQKLALESRPGDLVLSNTFERAVEAENCEALCHSTPNSAAGQKSLMVYRGDEWLTGLWDDPATPTSQPGLRLSSLADFYGGPLSKSARARRSGLDLVRGRQVLPGDYDVLVAATRSAHVTGVPHGYWECHPGVRRLAHWWNEHAPQEQRLAAFAHLYVWNEEDGAFDALDPEQPATLAEQMAKSRSMALFEREGFPTVAALFVRGQDYNRDVDGSAQVYCADGELFWEIGGLDASELDDAYYCGLALQNLRTLLDAKRPKRS